MNGAANLPAVANCIDKYFRRIDSENYAIITDAQFPVTF